jgi:hypothetical protein
LFRRGGFYENQINQNGTGCVEFNLLFIGNCPSRFPNLYPSSSTKSSRSGHRDGGEDGGLLKVIPRSSSDTGMLAVSLDETTNFDDNQGVLRIQKDGQAFFN